jgi:hypothetical protein
VSPEIRLPDLFGATAASGWASEWLRVADQPSLTIVLPREAFIEPIGAVLLATGIADRKSRSRDTRLRAEAIESPAMRYLQRIDFFAQLGVATTESFARHEPAGRFVPLRRVDSLRVAQDLANSLTDCLETQLPGLAPSPSRMARFLFEELGANVVQHSGRPETGFGMAQGYPKDRRLQIAFADCGIGFSRSLQRHPELAGRIADDGEALQIALGPGITSGTDPRQNMGFGLKLLASFADHAAGDLWLASGTAILRRHSTGGGHRVNSVRSASKWNGSWICLDVRLP